MSPIVDQTIRCINGENTLLKRVFRIPNPRRGVTTGFILFIILIIKQLLFSLIVYRISFYWFT
jgi:hypothetical protein